MSDALTPELLRSLEEVGALALGSGATTLSILLNKQVTIASPRATVVASNELGTVLKEPVVYVDVPASVAGDPLTMAFVLTQNDTSIITDLMMGGEGTPPSAIIDDLQLSAISEAINQMLGMAANTLNSTYGKKLEIQPPQAGVMDNPEDNSLPPSYQQGSLAAVAFQLSIEGLVTSTLVQLLPEESARVMGEAFAAQAASEKTVPAAAPPAPKAAPVPQPAPPTQAPQPAPQPVHAPAPQPAYAAAPQPAYAAPAAALAVPVNAQAAQFAPLGAASQTMAPPSGLDLVMDVPLKVTVELGRTRMQIRDVLELGKGSVVELDKLAGEPVDLLVNGKLIARGEVVVIDENFGIRVTDIVSPAERFTSFRA
ncbi:MAG TPA: flagellar motor switch phosphatase FliY [Pantanalinema sp.]